MSRRAVHLVALVFATMLVLLFAAPARAAEVEVHIPLVTEVGQPIEITVEIIDAERYETPVIPPIENGRLLAREPQVMRSSQTAIVGGQAQVRTTVTLTWHVMPEGEGTMIIPRFTVWADGRTFGSRPREVLVKARPMTGKPLFVEIAAPPETVYLGEPVELRLRIWIRVYRQQSLVLGEGQMWELVDQQRTRWGPFLERLQEWASQRRRPAGEEVIRDDGEGGRSAYYLYEVPTVVWPARAGPLEIAPVEVRVEYPQRLERDRGLLSLGQYRMTAVDRAIVAASVPPLDVIAPPEAGRPPWFNGAVGSFDLAVSAQPTDVAAGDPITITIDVTDRTEGPSPLHLLQAPPLLRVEPLTERFRIPEEPLAGTVQGRAKRFTQTIRPLNDQVDHVPPIPLSWFDPRAREYRTAWSEPIPIDVSPASTLAMSDVVGEGGAAAPPSGSLTEQRGGLVANYGGAAALLANQQFEPRWWLATLLALPPLIFGAAAAAQARRRRLGSDRAYARQRRARRAAMDRLAAARSAEGARRVELAGEALSGYVADRCNLPAGALTRAEVAGALRRRRAGAEITGEVERLLARCEEQRYAGAAGDGAADLLERAEQLVARLERERL